MQMGEHDSVKTHFRSSDRQMPVGSLPFGRPCHTTHPASDRPSGWLTRTSMMIWPKSPFLAVYATLPGLSHWVTCCPGLATLRLPRSFDSFDTIPSLFVNLFSHLLLLHRRSLFLLPHSHKDTKEHLMSAFLARAALTRSGCTRTAVTTSRFTASPQLWKTTAQHQSKQRLQSRLYSSEIGRASCRERVL